MTDLAARLSALEARDAMVEAQNSLLTALALHAQHADLDNVKFAFGAFLRARGVAVAPPSPPAAEGELKIDASAEELATFALQMAVLRMKARIDCGNESISIGRPSASEVVNACEMGIAALAAALRPPEGEVGALCERLEAVLSQPSVRIFARDDIRAALAHLRRLGQVEAENRRLRQMLKEVLIGSNHIATHIDHDGPAWTASHDEALAYYGPRLEYDMWCAWKTCMQVARDLRALAPAPAAEGGR